MTNKEDIKPKIKEISAYNQPINTDNCIDDVITLEQFYNRIIDPNFKVMSYKIENKVNISNSCKEIRDIQAKINELKNKEETEEIKNELGQLSLYKRLQKLKLGGCYIQTYKPVSMPKLGLVNNYFTGLMVVDYDDFNIDYKLSHEYIKKIPYVVMYFKTPSGGFKIIIDTNLNEIFKSPTLKQFAFLKDGLSRKNEANFKNAYKNAYHAMINKFKGTLFIESEGLEQFALSTLLPNEDKSAYENIFLVTYYSHDPEAYFNPNYKADSYNPSPLTLEEMDLVNKDEGDAILAAKNKQLLGNIESSENKFKSSTTASKKKISDEYITENEATRLFIEHFGSIWTETCEMISRSRGNHFDYTSMRNTTWWVRKFTIWTLEDCKANVTNIRPTEDTSITPDIVASLWAEYDENRAPFGLLYGVDILRKFNPSIVRNHFYQYVKDDTELKIEKLLENEDIYWLQSDGKIHRKNSQKQPNGAVFIDYKPEALGDFLLGNLLKFEDRFTLLKVLDRHGRKKLDLISSFTNNDEKYLNLTSRDNWLKPSDDKNYHYMFDVILDSLSDGDKEAKDHIEHCIARKYIHPEDYMIPCLSFNGEGESGKNCFVATVLKHIFTDNMIGVPNTSVFGTFNGELRGKAIVMIDEGSLSSNNQNKLKAWLGNRKIMINTKYGASGEYDNTAMYMLASNSLKGSVQLTGSSSDRRFSIFTINHNLPYWYAKKNNYQYVMNEKDKQEIVNRNNEIVDEMREVISVTLDHADEVAKWLAYIIEKHGKKTTPKALKNEYYSKMIETQKDSFELILDYVFNDPNFEYIKLSDLYTVYELYSKKNKSKHVIGIKKFGFDAKKYIEKTWVEGIDRGRAVCEGEKCKNIFYVKNGIKAGSYKSDTSSYYYKKNNHGTAIDLTSFYEYACEYGIQEYEDEQTIKTVVQKVGNINCDGSGNLPPPCEEIDSIWQHMNQDDFYDFVRYSESPNSPLLN
ncbi:DUF5906 domain-containing protein [Methylicorpusculum oleiharenae]|uniref:DUF5906 domain-containing protein n=1 Tax=Methylicorpusculum oleiharenae TaxID=1338687 RepID=UPI00135C6B77|nr:DUF5906 domain-containing protein [Methylicorpusculum oleiharenae]MCD2450203.1 DUF5906 domain-containing protein [Methylicorpusculum oleiharenae]